MNHEPVAWKDHEELREDMLAFFGRGNEEALEMWMRGNWTGPSPLFRLDSKLDRMLEERGYPVRGREREYLEGIEWRKREITEPVDDAKRKRKEFLEERGKKVMEEGAAKA
jgi:hypothetical protein